MLVCCRRSEMFKIASTWNCNSLSPLLLWHWNAARGNNNSPTYVSIQAWSSQQEKKAFETSIHLDWKCQQILQKSFNWKYFEVTIAICCSQLMTLKALEISWCRNSRTIHEFRRRELALHENLIVIDTFGHGNVLKWVWPKFFDNKLRLWYVCTLGIRINKNVLRITEHGKKTLISKLDYLDGVFHFIENMD